MTETGIMVKGKPDIAVQIPGSLLYIHPVSGGANKASCPIQMCQFPDGSSSVPGLLAFGTFPILGYRFSRLIAQSCLPLVTLWTAARQAPLSMGFSRQGYWTELPFPPPWDLPDSGTESLSLVSPASQAYSLPAEPQECSETPQTL